MHMRCSSLVLSSALLTLAVPVHALDFTGAIEMVEIWRNGNVAFRLSPGISSCNGQVILNASDPGFKNMFAAVLAAKAAGQALRVVVAGCGPADNYGGNYVIPEYIYPQ